MKFTNEVVEQVLQELCTIADNEPDDNSPNHAVFAKLMAMCRRWSSLLERVEDLEGWRDYALSEMLEYQGREIPNSCGPREYIYFSSIEGDGNEEFKTKESEE